MQWLFYTIAVAGLGYIVLRRRSFDVLALAFVSACIYFLPGFVGFVAYPVGFLLQPVPVADVTYLVMALVLVSNLGYMVVRDRLNPLSTARLAIANAQTPWESWIATAMTVVGVGLTIATVGSQLVSAEKFELLQQLNRWQIVWATCATLGFVLAWRQRAHGALVLNAVALAGNLYVGFRVDLAIAMLTVASMFLASGGPQRLVSRWRVALAVLAFGAFLFVFKYFQFALKVFDLGMIAEQAANPDALRLVFVTSEPFITQGILNEVLLRNYHVGMEHLLGTLYLILPLAKELGAQTVSFNDLFQSDLFSSVTQYGLANNFWAQMWSSGGWPMLVLAILLYHALLVWLESFMLRRGPAWQAMLGVLLTYFAFYIHRNDLLYQLTLARRVLMFAAAIAVIAWACRYLGLPQSARFAWAHRTGAAR